jgi:AcrR family transcriptional regulator
MKLEAAPRRRYRMGARADAAAATGERILDAAVELFWEGPTSEIALEDVARRAGVSVQTVIRRFGGKDGLMAAAGDRETARIAEQRNLPEPGDVQAAVKVLIDHYEETGDRVLRMLAEEGRMPAISPLIERGRKMHREWCTRMFGFALGRRSGSDRRRLLAQLIAVCDVYTWKLLRRDCGLGRRQTELALIELLNPILEAA